MSDSLFVGYIIDTQEHHSISLCNSSICRPTDGYRGHMELTFSQNSRTQIENDHMLNRLPNDILLVKCNDCLVNYGRRPNQIRY